jgi:hypothetical protein
MFFLFHTGSIYVLKARGGFEWATCTKTGPNDARRVVWATGTCFCQFYKLTNVFFVLFRFYLRLKSTGRGLDGRREQKRAQTTPDASFGPQVRVFVSFCKFYILTNVFLFYLGSIYV